MPFGPNPPFWACLGVGPQGYLALWVVWKVELWHAASVHRMLLTDGTAACRPLRFYWFWQGSGATKVSGTQRVQGPVGAGNRAAEAGHANPRPWISAGAHATPTRSPIGCAPTADAVRPSGTPVPPPAPVGDRFDARDGPRGAHRGGKWVRKRTNGSGNGPKNPRAANAQCVRTRMACRSDVAVRFRGPGSPVPWGPPLVPSILGVVPRVLGVVPRVLGVP